MVFVLDKTGFVAERGLEGTVNNSEVKKAGM
jgi:hypothetical protein